MSGGRIIESDQRLNRCRRLELTLEENCLRGLRFPAKVRRDSAQHTIKRDRPQQSSHLDLLFLFSSAATIAPSAYVCLFPIIAALLPRDRLQRPDDPTRFAYFWASPNRPQESAVMSGRDTHRIQRRTVTPT